MILALLKGEYDRVASPCLTVRVIWEENERGRNLARFLEVRNCGSITIESVDWTMTEAQGWYLSDANPRPYPRLEPDEGIREVLSLTIGREPLATFTLTGLVDGRPYSVEKTISGLAS